MLMRQCGSLGAVISAFGLFLQISTGQALAQDRRQECSAKYKTAKVEGSLGGLTWPQFFSRCMAELKAASETPAEAKPTGAVAQPVNPLKPVPAAPAQPAEIEPVPTPVPSIAEAPAPATPSSPAVEALTATPPTPEIAAPSRPALAPAETTSQTTPTVPPKVAPVAPAAAPAVPPEAPSAQAPSPAPRGPVFPSAIAPAHAKEKPHIARRKTCQDQYNANKATDSNGGLKWAEKGGGYLSECNKRLKGAP